MALLIADDDQNNWADITINFNPDCCTIKGGTQGTNMDTAIVNLGQFGQYAFSGLCLGDAGHQILQPINADGTSVFKQGSTVPAKFRVCDFNGLSVGTPGLVTSFKLVKVSSLSASATVDESVFSTTPDTAFRFDTSGNQWIFNISTKPLAKGSRYFYVITLSNGSTIPFNFGLR
jgi:hypothetical protein